MGHFERKTKNILLFHYKKEKEKNLSTPLLDFMMKKNTTCYTSPYSTIRCC